MQTCEDEVLNESVVPSGREFPLCRTREKTSGAASGRRQRPARRTGAYPKTGAKKHARRTLSRTQACPIYTDRNGRMMARIVTIAVVFHKSSSFSLLYKILTLNSISDYTGSTRFLSRAFKKNLPFCIFSRFFPLNPGIRCPAAPGLLYWR